MTTTCVRCARTMPDPGPICHADALSLSVSLREAAGHAEDAWTVLARQTRYGAGGRGGFSEPLPVDLTASATMTAANNTIGTWARIVLEESTAQPPGPWRPTAGPLCPPRRPGDEPRRGNRCDHASCAAIRDRTPPAALAEACAWLAQQTAWLRRHPAADEAFRELHDACAQLARLVDSPPAKDLVGMCDCGKVLYAAPGRSVVTCPEKTCQLRWEVTKSRDILMRHLDGRLVTAGEAARLAAYLDGDRTQEQIRALITGWAKRGLILAHGHVWRDPTEAELKADPPVTGQVAVPTFRFGEVRDRLAATPRRNREGAAA